MSYRKYFIYVTIIIFINLVFNGCYSLEEITILKDEEIKIYKIETLDNKIIDFQNNQLGYGFLSNNEIVSFNFDKGKEVYPVSTIKKYYTERFDAYKTVWLVIGSAAALYVVLITLIAIGMEGRGFGG